MAATSAPSSQSEWTKIRSVRSTVWTLALAFLVTLALGAIICAVSQQPVEFDVALRQGDLRRDPTPSFFGMTARGSSR